MERVEEREERREIMGKRERDAVPVYLVINLVKISVPIFLPVEISTIFRAENYTGRNLGTKNLTGRNFGIQIYTGTILSPIFLPVLF